jgi:hypothetical protein
MNKITFLIFLLVSSLGFSQPTTNAPVPNRLQANVISIYSDSYTSVATDLNPGWGQSGTVNTTFNPTGTGTNFTLAYTNFNYQGTLLTTQNASSMEYLHVDVWCSANPATSILQVSPINIGGTGIKETLVTVKYTSGSWTSVDIPKSSFTGQTWDSITQLKFAANGAGSTTPINVYLDNIYFWKAPPAAGTPTITGFSVPSKIMGDAPFAITPPTSNSLGSFTYTSSNSAVATIIGNTITVVGAGTSTITANQAANGSYSAGSTTALFIVDYAPPMVAAPTPPVRVAAEVKNFYSSAYTEIAGTDWNPNWSQTTVASEILIAGNATRKMTNLNYQGAQFAAAQNVSALNTLHLDVWTPDCTSFKVSLISAGAGMENAVTLTPKLSGWNSFDIPLTSYNVPNLSAITQFKFESVTAGKTVYLDNIYFWKNANALAAPSLPIDFESSTVDYTFTDFDGGVATKIANPNSGGNNTSATVAKMIKGPGAVWAGSYLILAAPINFSVNKLFKVKVYSPRVGARLLLKVEGAAGVATFEKEVASTVANAWEELSIDYSAVSTTNQYTKLVFIFDNNNMGDSSANYTFLFDEIRLVAPTGPVLTQMSLPITFESSTVDYGLISFGGTTSSIVVDPTLATNKVAKVIKNAPDTSAGTTVTGASELGFSPAIPFTSAERKMNVRVWSPTAGIPVRLKVEVHGQPTQSVETEALTTVANGWQTMEFNFNNQATGTSPFNTAYSYDKASIFFNFGVVGSGQTYYFDDMKFGAALGIASFEASNIRMYPNPTATFFTIEAKEVIENVSLYNVLGQEVLAKTTNSNLVSLDVANLQTGVYVVKTTIGGVVASSRLVKN